MISKAQQKAVNKYVKSNYDSIQLRLPKGQKSLLKAESARQGISLNLYIKKAIQAQFFVDTNQLLEITKEQSQ